MYRNCGYESCYLEMRDGVKIAIDVLTPALGSAVVSQRLPSVLLQTRYMRGAAPRWPLSKVLKGRPLDLLMQEAKSWFLAAGYVVVTIDVRGTGASTGVWRAPWTLQERADSIEVLDWIVRQPWSDGQVCLWGVSYDGTIALFTVAEKHPAVRAAAPQYVFFDMYNNIGLPGGIPLHSFISTWTKCCEAMDNNRLSRLPFPNGCLVPLITRGTQPVVEGRVLGGKGIMPVGRAGPGLATSKDVRRAKSRGAKALAEAVKGHSTWSASKDLEDVRCADDVAPLAGLRITDVSACSVSCCIAASSTPLLLTAGWMDSTAAPAIHIFCNANKCPGSKMLIGPWTHGGNMQVRLSSATSTPSQLRQTLECIRFFDAACGYAPTHRSEALFGGSSAAAPGAATGMHGGVTSGVGHDGMGNGGRGQGPPCPHSPPAPTNASRLSFPPAVTDAGGNPNGHSNDPAVRYFVMGCRPRWKATDVWPPHDSRPHPMRLFLGGNSLRNGRGITERTGDVRDMPPGSHGSLLGGGYAHAEVLRWHHDVNPSKYLKGTSRYDVITQPYKGVRYRKLQSSGHILFTGMPLQEEVELVGWVTVECWISSSHTDADVFVYLEDYDPAARKARYVTEGQFRASHRCEQDIPPPGNPRGSAHLAGAPFHTYNRSDVQPLHPGVPARCCFQLLPTAYGFGSGHCVRIAIAGADAKHFTMDHEGPRELCVLSGADFPSVVILPVSDAN